MKRFLGLALLLAWLPAHADLEGLRTAAQAGDVNAQLELGQLYEFGFGLKENAVPAMAWYLSASRNGNARAGERAAVLKPKLSAAQLQAAERLSREWAPTTRPAAAAPVTPAASDAPMPSTPTQTPKSPAPTVSKPGAASPTPPPAPPPAPATSPPAQASPPPAPKPAAPETAKPGQSDPASARPSAPTGAAPAPEKPSPAPADDGKLGPG